MSSPRSTIRVQQYLHLDKVKYNKLYLQSYICAVYTTPLCQYRLCKADDVVSSPATEACSLESSQVQPATFD